MNDVQDEKKFTRIVTLLQTSASIASIKEKSMDQSVDWLTIHFIICGL